MTVAVGTIEGSGARVVGVAVPDGSPPPVGGAVTLGGGVALYPQSVSPVPAGIGDGDAISTVSASLASVHCSAPRVGAVGGDSGGSSRVWGRAVVMGGSDLAVFAARGLAALGADVTLVTTGKPTKMGLDYDDLGKKVEVLPPAVGDQELGFASVIGTFDSLVDTIHDEGAPGEDDASPFTGGRVRGATAELGRQHGCDRYVSTFTESQRIVNGAGIIFGPSKANEYESELLRNLPGMGRPIVPPRGFGPCTVRTLLDSGVVFKDKGGGGGKGDGDAYLRGWSLRDFWEYTSWPRDSSGGGDVRYGLPVVDDMAAMEEDDDEDEEEEEDERTRSGREAETNPFVLEIEGVDHLRDEIVSRNRNAVLFLSAPWCRKCRLLKPVYNRMARAAAEGRSEGGGGGGGNDAVTYAKAETSTESGKGLGRSLGVDAVPAFVVFRAGEVYGRPMSISRLPSEELDRAVEVLKSGGR